MGKEKTMTLVSFILCYGHEELSRLVLSYFFSSNILPQVMFNIQFISKTNETTVSIFTDDPGSHIVVLT